MKLDVAVVGGGAAGLSAALVLSRARRSVVVFDDGKPRNARVPHSFGFVGHDGISGAELVRRGRAEVAHYGGRFVDEQVVAIDPCSDECFIVATAHARVEVRAVVLATGFVDRLPEIDGLAEIWGTDAADCPYCHGWEARDGALAVIGSPGRLPRTAALLTVWSKDVMLVSSGARDYGPDVFARLDAAGVRIVPHDVRSVVTSGDRLTSIVLDDGRRIPRDTLFVATKRVPRVDLIRDLCELDESGFAVTDGEGRTSRSGVWAVGNVTDHIAKLVHAAAAGSRAATRVNEYLLERDLCVKAVLDD